ncbi:MAG: hypothetical protein NZM37_03465, partial [Sandaracinaceae bacterium]|nr:hypothetical protein [Sandaracinaceae bacterium]
DTCAGAIALSGQSGTRTDPFDGARRDVSGCEDGAGPDVFYSITVSEPSLLYVDTFGSSFDTQISIRSSCTGDPLVCEDDDCVTLQDQAVAILSSAGTYYVVVHAFGRDTRTGTIRLRWQTLPSGSGMPVRITGSMPITGMTSGSGTVSGSCGGGIAPEVLHYFTLCPGQMPTITADSCASEFDTVLYARSGDGGMELACNDDRPNPPDSPACTMGSGMGRYTSYITFTATGPGLFGIYVDGFGGESGNYTLRVSGLP